MASCRFAFAVHILAVLAYRQSVEISSERLARSVNTNPVVVRRLLSELRRAGLITTLRGGRGGARLSRAAAQITLAEVYGAVSRGTAFSSHPQPPNLACPVGAGIQRVLAEVFCSAEAALQQALAARTLADVMATLSEDAASPALEPALA